MAVGGHHFTHYCEHSGCDAWGAFGFGVDLRGGRRGRWFCEDHRADGAPKPEAPRPAPCPTGLPLFGGGCDER
jgi:hypothetical protein